MIESDARVEQFKAEIAEMKVRDPSRGRDELLGRAGVVLMVLGLALGVVAYFLSHGTSNALQQRDAIVLALIGVSACVVGAALYVRNTLTGFLRFWLARLVYEQKAQTDRMLGTQSDGLEDAVE
jgi:hypothetical protein